MGLKEDVLALAEELDGVSIKDDCDACFASGTGLCRGDLECAESAHKACAKRLREIVEHDECEDTTVSAYDLLSDEDREALAWVREHGGLGAVNKRLMPEGMEWLLEVWPKWSNGEYCKFGDWWTAAEYGCYEPKQLRRLGFYTPEQLKEWEQDEGDNYGYEWNFMRPSDTNYRPDKAETPASKVLAADGEPLEVGQTVYAPHYDYVRCTVLSFEWAVDGWLVEVENESGCKFRQTPDAFIHKRPVFDADGVPIREGDTVWSTRDSKSGAVVYAYPPGYDGQPSVKVGATWHHAPDLTHAKPEQPDTWERLEHDAEKTVCEYFGANYDCANCPLESARCDEEAKKDIIRRAKKLAERGA